MIHIKKIHGAVIHTVIPMTRDWTEVYHHDVPVTVRKHRKLTIAGLLQMRLAQLNAQRIVREKAEYRAAIAAQYR